MIILGRAAVFVVAPGEKLQDSRPGGMAPHCLESLSGGAPNLFDVVSISGEKMAPVAAGIAAKIKVRRPPGFEGSIDGKAVILANEEHGQFQNAPQVTRFAQNPLLGGAFAKKCRRGQVASHSL